jgi:hypothetical protein
MAENMEPKNTITVAKKWTSDLVGSKIGTGEDSEHARRALRGRDVDLPDLGVGVG